SEDGTMTVEEWLTGADPALAAALRERGAATQRKVRLLLCAACRNRKGLRPELVDPRSRQAVEVAERFVEGNCSLEELRTASGAVRELCSTLNAEWHAAMEQPLVYWEVTIRYWWARLADSAVRLPEALIRTGEHDADDGVWCALHDAST